MVSSSDKNLSKLRWTIDNKEDYDMVNEIYQHRKNKKGLLLMNEILDILKDNHEIVNINSKVKRSTMYQ